MRLFVAVPAAEELKERVAKVQDEIRKAGVDAKLVEKENLHFTVKFLGEANEEKMTKIKNALEKACGDRKPFDIAISGVSAFPSKDYARAIWLSVGEGFGEFESLIKDIDEELSKIGYEKDRTHVPHLTLARVRPGGRNKSGLLKLMEALEKKEIGKMKVNEIKIMKSTLSRTCPLYEELYCVKLR